MFLDSSSCTTVDQRGVKDVAVRTTGHDKANVTVCLSATSDGVHLKPMVLIPRKRPLKELEKFNRELVIIYNGSTWMDNNMTKEYLKKVLGCQLFGRRLLVWDSFRAHISDSTKSECKNLNIDMATVPGGCTKFIQAPDVVWNKPFKSNWYMCACKSVFYLPLFVFR